MSRMPSVNIDIGLGTEAAPALERTGDEPFRLALLGDFGGRAHRGEPRLHREPLLLDPDTFEELMLQLDAGLELSVGGAPLRPRFRELEDFHPDRLYQSLPLFEGLRQTRAQLANPTTFRAAAARLEPPTPAPARPFTGSLLDQIVDQTPEAAAPTPHDDKGWNEVIRRIVAPHLVPRPEPRQNELLAQVDAATGAAMRAILSHPEFQALEAAWRSAFFLLQRLETGTELKILLIDITRDELLQAARDGIAPFREGWSAAACLHSFAATEADCAALADLAGMARRAGGPLLAGMHPRVMGCESMAATPDPDDWSRPLDDAAAQAWRHLRAHPDARWLGLALPRFLLRLPYGQATSSAEDFPFEEMARPAHHEAYLWGSPAVVCACLLGQGFQARGWQFHPGLRNQLDGLPAHTYRIEGEPRMTPPAETWITDRVAARILDQGLMPLCSSRNGDAILLPRSQSIADPPRPLAGAWSTGGITLE